MSYFYLSFENRVPLLVPLGIRQMWEYPLNHWMYSPKPGTVYRGHCCLVSFFKEGISWKVERNISSQNQSHFYTRTFKSKISYTHAFVRAPLCADSGFSFNLIFCVNSVLNIILLYSLLHKHGRRDSRKEDRGMRSIKRCSRSSRGLTLRRVESGTRATCPSKYI